jgi:hypothetical protein
MDQILKTEHQRLLAIEDAARRLVGNIYTAGPFGIPTVDPSDLAALKRSLARKVKTCINAQ